MLVTQSGNVLLPYYAAATVSTCAHRATRAPASLSRVLKHTVQVYTRPFKLAAEAYGKLSAARPYLTSALTGTTILATSDFVSQNIEAHMERRKLQWNKRRTLALSSFGFIYYGIALKRIYYAYEWMFACSTRKAVFDFAVHTPFGLIPFFYMWTGMMKGQTLNKCVDELKSKWFESAIGSVGVWGPACAVNFTLVPAHYRILWVCMVSFFHKIWLSCVSNREDGDQKDKVVARVTLPTTSLPTTPISKLKTDVLMATA